ncbi:MAG: hypothetical protein AB7I41_21410 [Candidatus Sericytochromatia bacterium]
MGPLKVNSAQVNTPSVMPARVLQAPTAPAEIQPSSPSTAQPPPSSVALPSQGQAAPSLPFIEHQYGSALGDRVESMEMAGLAGADMQALQNYAQNLIRQPEDLHAVIGALQTALSSVQAPVMMVDFCTLSPEQQEKLTDCFEKVGCTDLLATLESGNTQLSFETIGALYYSLKPIHTLISSQDPSERNAALFQLKVSNDLLKVLPALQASKQMNEDTLAVMDFSNSLTGLSAKNSASSGLSRLSKEIVETQARGTFDAAALSKTTSRLTLSPLDTVLGNLLLEPSDSNKAQNLTQLLQRFEQGTLSTQDRAKLIAFGLEEKAGKLYVTDGKTASATALSVEDLSQIKQIASALATPVAHRSKEVQAFLETFQTVIKNTQLLETLIQKRNDLQSKADQLLAQLNQDESDLSEIEATLGDLEGLLKRFNKDGLTDRDIRILAKLGIDIRDGHFVKNKFFDANGNLIKRKDIEAFLRAKQTELTQEIARKRQELGTINQAIGKTDEAIAQTATDLISSQRALDNSYQRLSPAEQALFAPAYESARRQTRQALAQAIQALLKGNLDPQLLQKLMDELGRLDREAPQATESAKQHSEAPSSENLAPSPEKVVVEVRTPGLEAEMAFNQLEADRAQAKVVQKKLETQLLDHAGQSRRRNRERAESRQAWLQIAQDQLLNEAQLKSMLKDSPPVPLTPTP